MYTQFYGFSKLPFSITPDPKFVYYSKSHHEALAQMLYGIQERKCLMVCVGEVGVGKTTMIFTLMSHLGKDVTASMIFDTHVDPESLYQYMFADFGLGEPKGTRAENTIVLKNFLAHRLAEGQKSLLILDEAHNLSREIFHEVVHLTNFETRSDKLLQIVLVGQPELKTVLNSMEFRQLKQRINLRTTIQPLDVNDTTSYIRHRIQAGGSENLDLFTPDALELVHQYSAGLPRMINTLCDNALLLGFSRHQERIDGELIRHAYVEMMDLGEAPEPPGAPLPIPAAAQPRAAAPAPAPPARASVPPPAPPTPAPVAAPVAPTAPTAPAVAAPPTPAAPARNGVAAHPAPLILEPEPPTEVASALPPVEETPPAAPFLPLTDRAARELMPTLVQEDPAARRQYHLLATRLEAISRTAPLRTILITSSVPQEGKSITTINLAFTLAQDPENRVLLVDADLRQPALHTYFGHRAIAGLSEVLQGQVPLDQALHRVQFENLYVLFAGKKPSQPGELLGSAAMTELLGLARRRFHYVLIDSPPVVPIADTCTLAAMVDGVILVIRSRFTDRAVVHQALEDLNHSRLLGIVYNNQQVKAARSRYQYGYGYVDPGKTA